MASQSVLQCPSQSVFHTHSDCLNNPISGPSEKADLFVSDAFKKLASTILKPLQTGEVFEDGRTLIFVNGEIEDDTPLGRLVRDFKLTDPKQMCYDVLKKAREEEMRNYFLTTGRPENELLDNYLKEYEDVARKEGKAEGLAQGKNEKATEVAKAMLADGIPLEKVSQYSSIPIEDLKKLISAID